MINFTEFCLKLKQCGVSEYIVKTLSYLYGLLSECNRDYFCSRMYHVLGSGEIEKFYMDITDTTEDVKLMDEIMDLLDGWAFSVQVKELGEYVRHWELYSLLPAED